MNASSRYWNICQISLAKERAGYEYRLVEAAREFFRQTVSDSLHPQNGDIQTTFFSHFQAPNSAIDANQYTGAGFCLRCYVSPFILKACQKIESLFSGQKSFSYRDLLPFVLNDDGQTPLILGKDGQTQLVVDKNGNTKIKAYKFFSVEILGTYNPDSSSSMSLKNWAFLKTKQNKELKTFLSEFGFNDQSDWALMNRARTKQLECLSKHDRHLVEVFHQVYRRDRRKQRQKGAKQCPDPNEVQLKEMLTQLQEQDVNINTAVELINELKQVANQLRQYDVWSYREPLEIKEPLTGSYVLRPDLPHDSSNEIDVEQQEILQFLHQQFKLALVSAIEKEIQGSITKLQKSKRYAPLAGKFLPGLQLYYCQGKSLKEIAPQLGMTSWDQARRVLDPGGFVLKVRTSCIQKLFDRILKKALEKGLTKNPPKADYLKTLAKQIEDFADAEVFQEAAAEIRAGKNRSLNSLYAEQLRLYLKQQI